MDAEYAGKRKKTRREVFLEQIELEMRWKVLLKTIEPHYPTACLGGRPYALGRSCVCTYAELVCARDPATEQALYESLAPQARALSLNEPIPDETTILNFRHLGEANDLASHAEGDQCASGRKGLLLKRTRLA